MLQERSGAVNLAIFPGTNSPVGLLTSALRHQQSATITFAIDEHVLGSVIERMQLAGAVIEEPHSQDYDWQK